MTLRGLRTRNGRLLSPDDGGYLNRGPVSIQARAYDDSTELLHDAIRRSGHGGIDIAYALSLDAPLWQCITKRLARRP